MCIIVAKPRGVAMPDIDILTKCFNSNHDGAGFMFAHNGVVRGYKGFMTFAQMIAKLDELENEFGDWTEKSIVLHFRIGTHGTNIPSNTHPFPLGCGYRSMRKLEWTAEQGLAHNGIIYDLSKHADVKKYNVSDTMVFVKHYATPISRWTNIVRDTDAQRILDAICGGKLALMDGSGKIATCGYFYEEDGVLYSNTSYRKNEMVMQGNWSGYSNNNGYYYGYDEYDSYSYPTNVTYIDERAAKRYADKAGLIMVGGGIYVYANDDAPDGIILDTECAYDPENGDVYQWAARLYKWLPLYSSPTATIYDYDQNEIIYPILVAR